MAVIIRGPGDGFEFGSSSVASFTMDLGPGSWEPGPSPCAGDLVVLEVRQPWTVPVIPPPGWTASEYGRVCYKVWGSTEPASVTFQAPGALEWDVKGYAIAAGSYESPDLNAGSSVSNFPASGGQPPR